MFAKLTKRTKPYMPRLRSSITSSTAQLAGTYLVIIMVMSLGFSIVLYRTSSHELGRQLPPSSLVPSQVEIQSFGNGFGTNQTGQSGQDSQGQTLQIGQRPELNEFLRTRIREGKRELMTKLVVLNIGSLVVGGVLSYYLARRSLRPIEQAMEAQSQFVSDASHELRTPLTAIQTSNEVFLRRPKATITDAKKLIEQNTDDVKRLKQLSDGLLDLAQRKQGESHFKPVKIQGVVSEALTQVVNQATQKNISVQDEVADITVLGDHSALAQALVILLDNAIKYSDDGQTVSLTSHIKSKNAYVSVKDEGIGIRASDMPHLFRRFYRADNSRSGGERGGYGLGLAIAKQIAENHQGEILASSTPGKGSTFTIKLPIA